MSASGSFPPRAGGPFTLWLDPSRWPVPPFRLPGRAFTVWLDPARWPKRICRLPALGHTLWLDPACWPLARFRLPSAGFTLWLNPETWPRAVELSLPVPAPRPAMSIQISRNNAFTLWTRPAQVTPIPMKNGLTAAQLAAASAPTPSASPAESLVPAAPSREAVGSTASETASVPLSHRLMPLAAGVVAVMGLDALVRTAETKKETASAVELADLGQRVALVAKSVENVKAEHAKKAAGYQGEIAELEAKALGTKAEAERLAAVLKQSQETLQQTETKLAAQEKQAQEWSSQAAEAKLAASTADTKAQTLVVAATEEASAVKREAAAEVVKLKEALAKLESEKAAALKAAADAARENAALQQTLDSRKKPAP